jgi:hypothetical protein
MVAILIGGLFGLVGLYSLWLTVINIRDLVSFHRWQRTDGSIVQSKVDTLEHDTGREYVVQIAYQYTINGVLFRNDRLSLFALDRLHHGERRDAERQQQSYPLLERLTVFYDPANPKRSALDTDWSWGRWLSGALLSAGLIAISVLFPLAVR